MTRLWKVRVTYEFDVLFAADEKPACFDFADAARDDINENHHTPEVGRVQEVRSPADIPSQWRGARPYGETNCPTVESVLISRAHEQAAVEADPRQRSLLGNAPEFTPAEVVEINIHRAILAQAGTIRQWRELSNGERGILHELAVAETPAVRRFYKERAC